MHVISTSDLLGPDWQFLAPVCTDPNLTWETHSGRPRNALERMIRHPALARWRAAATAARSARARDDAVLVSHLPGMAAATNLMRRAICPKTRHIAFAFNFTDLPQGRRRAWFRHALRGIDEFVVFSHFERPLYAAHFGISEDRIRFLPWAMERPVPGPHNPVQDIVAAGYLCAIGGEARDYALLADVMRRKPEVPLVIVARPYSIAGLTFPPNVRVFTNLPAPETWRIAVDSRGLLIPLKTDTTACGHITLVGAQLLGLPLVITRSRGVEDYVTDGETARLVTAGDADALEAAIGKLGGDPEATRAMAQRARIQAEKRSTVGTWVEYFRLRSA